LLGQWKTRQVADGDYEIRLSVEDTLGLVGVSRVAVVVDNEPPWASETTPTVVNPASGGDVFTTNNEVHLYFPPRAFAESATVTIAPATDVPDSLPGGAQLVLAGYEIGWGGASLEKRATLEMALAERRTPGLFQAFYLLADGEEWRRIGGTESEDDSRLAAPIEDEGIYAVYADPGGGSEGGLTDLSFTPRVFSPSGSFADDEIRIGFMLGRSGSVTAKVYNRAGRLVKELASGLAANAGVNLLRWDGRDSDGIEVPDGLYLVTVDALGETQTSTLAVVR